jgi:KDO2-lipid IV(A) lauroyltransferase
MIGELGRRVDHQRYEQAQGRIVAALQVDRNRAAGIARECYRSLGRFLVECLALPDYGEPAAGELFEVRGLEHLRRAAAAGRGVLLFSAHFGNWEAAAMHQATLGLPMSLVVKPSTNGLIEKQLTLWRESSGNVMVAHRGAFKSLTRELRRGGLAGFLIDQYSSRQTLRLPFFGQLASYTPLLGFLAVRLEVPVIPLRALPLPAGRHRIDYYPPLEIPTSGTVNERVLATTTAASQLIESWIRERPGCWLWLHDRWKHRE